ncbi:hypothetical protein B0H16DRAFT_1489021 [Mycena metata]|uniref:F-box domain-containing protein n=1 Tax=Mycena metata TaxID=1033252 RepID=A0AAD7KKX5_9AGAR|nr:hypothetical protein B0H16DRAFT_1489021 [Mycena metata]
MASHASLDSAGLSLDALPNELLYEILKRVNTGKDIRSRYKTCIRFASVNRHFRQLALPSAVKFIPVSGCKQLPAMFQLFWRHLSQIKNIAVDHSPLYQLFMDDARTDSRWEGLNSTLPPGLNFARLNNLVHFDCTGFCFQPHALQNLLGVSNSVILSLRLGWRMSNFFPFKSFPSLKHLFIYNTPVMIYEDPVTCEPGVFPSLTTLSIMDNMRWFETHIYGSATFPNLRAFHILSSSSDNLFRFISDHPTLLEVNLPRCSVYFPSFIRLAKDDLTLDLSRTDHPDFDVWNELYLAGFSFVREGTSSVKAVKPVHHILSELSLETAKFSGPLSLHDIGGLGGFPLFVACTRLSLVLSDLEDVFEDPDSATVVSLVSVLGTSLARWKNLRHLYFACTFPDAWDVDYDDDNEDIVLLPEGDNPSDFKTYSELQDPENFRQKLHDLGLEFDDEFCSLQLWRTAKEKEMAALVRELARGCATLEVFEWSIRAEDFDSTELSLGICPHPPLWRWDIHRTCDGEVESLSQRLTWNGHPDHPSSCLDEQFKLFEKWSTRYET